ncbi:unnamed protein product [Schistocephalus solidus]|uniref:WD_REPEATS_REGION domain-containing protein n=1 Tax=Schistocephalus solidus TaxID=70667 RepID=A0A183TEL8_SCHSO|nr:unnamed protein product [Schistocephalus solidus]
MNTAGIPTRFHRKKVEQEVRKSKSAQRQLRRIATVNPEWAGFVDQTDENEILNQEAILKQVDLGSTTKRFDLTLNSGPYCIDYSRNGRFLSLCGKRGHVAAFDWMTKRLLFETNVGEECHDVKFLHQETVIAVAQKGYTYIYDNQGIELHCLKRLSDILRLEFLPYHFLLVAMANNGFMYYLDCSVGEVVASYPTFLGSLGVACQNPSNAVILTGHPSGVVSMWTPTEKNPVVKILCHKSAVQSISVHRSGQYLASCGLDRALKIWDLRSTYDCLAEVTLPTPANSIDFSQLGLLAIGSSTTVQVLKDPTQTGTLSLNPGANMRNVERGVGRRVLRTAFLTHNCQRPVNRVRFCPYEDVIGVGTSGGILSLLCPGSGEPNYDALEENPFANRRYRQEREVRRLLDKIPHTMISIDSMLGKVRREDIVDEWQKKRNALLGEIPKVEMPMVNRKKKKGRSKPGRIEKKKQLIRLERKLFEVSSVLRQKVPRLGKNKKEKRGLLPSDLFVNEKRSKRRTKSALDVLISKQN